MSFTPSIPSTHGLLASFLVALILSGCAGSSLSTHGDATIASYEARLLPTTQGDEPALVPIASGGFVGCVLGDEGELTLTRFNDDLSIAWATPIAHDDGTSRFGVGPELHGWVGYRLPDPRERVLSLLATGSHIVMLSYRTGAEDRNEAIGRLIDASNGALIETKVVHAAAALPGEYRRSTDPAFARVDSIRRCYAAVSSDSSRIVVYSFSPRLTGPDLAYTVIDTRLDIVRRGTATGERVARPERTTLAVDARGDVFILRQSGSALQLETSRADGSSGVLETPEIESGRLDGIRIVVDGRRVLGFAGVEGEEGLEGIAVGTFDTESRTVRLGRVAITPEILERAIDADDLKSAHLHPVVVADGPTRYVLLFEHRTKWTWVEQRPGYSPQQAASATGDLLVVGLDAEGEARWFGGIEKSVMFEDNRHGYHFHFMTVRPHVAAGRLLEVAYREGFVVGVRRFDLASGSVVADIPIIEATRAAFPKTSTVTWLGDRRIVLLSKHGVFGADFFVNLVRY